MKSMNCRSVRREIEEANPGDLFHPDANLHIENCLECETFADEHLKLQKIVSSLGTVAAPDDFEFRLRARLAAEKPGTAQPFVFRNLSFGFRSAAFAAIVMLIGAGLLFVSLRSPADGPLAVKEPSQQTNKTREIANNKENKGRQNGSSELTPGTLAPKTSQTVPDRKLTSVAQHSNSDRGKPRIASVASVREADGLKTRDLSSSPATVVKRSTQLAEVYPTSSFPIEAAYQSLKVSLDDGRGSWRTISLPSVSFGSQRVLAQSSSPLLEPARGSW